MFKFLVLLLTVFIFSSCTQKKITLVQNLNQSDANNIMLILANNNITADEVADKDGLNYSIQIDAKNQVLALQLLSNFGEPVTKRTTLGEVFHKDNMISSPMEEYARYTFALNQEIEGTLSQIDGIISVKVNVSLPVPTENLWSSQTAKPGAAIFIKYRSGFRIDLLTNRIKVLVSKAVPGLTPDMVEVLNLEKKDKS